ncbi:hypothetical protein OB905_13855 [Halobacteria archaeon AArc-dxtr1]|nr:hypothetical protein [Halobacteria archaeon AArc-dxtr1]
MADTARSSVGGALSVLASSVGTVVGLAWLGVAIGLVVSRVVGLSGTENPTLVRVSAIAILAVALAGTTWLVEGGYERIGADPNAGGQFAWLAIFFVPLAFAPTRVALGSVTGTAGVLDALFVLATGVAAGWLAFYGGLERLGIVPQDFLRVIAYAIAFGLVVAAAAVVLDLALLDDDRAIGVAALGVQIAACWFGFTKTVP